MDLARAPRRAARKKGSGYENETYYSYLYTRLENRVLYTVRANNICIRSI
jgi:hypothetical protein